VAERTERRIRAVVAAFEHELADRLAEIDAEAALIAQPHVLTADELSALDQAVRKIARELTAGSP
jgi:asparagine synthetase A